MMQLTRTVLALVSVVVAFAACDDPVQIGVDEDLVGTYDLITYRGWPIPYSQSNDAFYHRGGTLELRRSGRFIKTELITGVTWTIHGDYFPRGERVALVQDDGVTYTFSRPRAGVLTDPWLFYSKQGEALAPEHQWKRYQLTSCDGHVPSNYYPCPGTSTRGSELWLRENLRIDAADGGAGATVHTEGAYQLQGEVITVTGLGEHRSGGVLRGGVLTLGGWIYEEVP